MSKKNAYKKDPRKNTRVFYTLAKKDHEDYGAGSLNNLAKLYRTMHGDDNSYCAMFDCAGGDMLIVRCKPKEYDEFRKSMEYLRPGLYAWDVDVSKTAECIE